MRYPGAVVKGNLWLKTHCRKKKKVGRFVPQCSQGFVAATQRTGTAGQETPFSWFPATCSHPSHSSLQTLKYTTTVSLPCSKPSHRSPLLQGETQKGPQQADLSWLCSYSPLSPLPLGAVCLCATSGFLNCPLKSGAFFPSSPFPLELGLPDKIQDSQLNLNFK